MEGTQSNEASVSPMCTVGLKWGWGVEGGLPPKLLFHRRERGLYIFLLLPCLLVVVFGYSQILKLCWHRFWTTLGKIR